MRDVITKAVEETIPPTPEERRDAAEGEATFERHAGYLSGWSCLQTVEHHQPPVDLPKPRNLTIGAWNIERCKRVEDSAALIRQTGIDILLATELDHGMARSEQRHTTRDVASALGFGYVFGVEFVELGTGDDYETALFADVANMHGLHGNAILSRYPVQAPRLLPLDDRGMWYTGAPKSDGQRRVGGRMAVAVDIETTEGAITFVSVHYESESDTSGRLEQTETLLSQLDATRPMVIGGDLNTAALAGVCNAEVLQNPHPHESCFGAFAAAGFEWRTANTGHPTTRAAPGRPVKYPLKRLDWLFTRGVTAYAPQTTPAVSEQGEYLSDHELIVAQVTP